MSTGEKIISDAPSFREFRALREAAANSVSEDFQLESEFLLIVMGKLGLRPGEAAHITKEWVNFKEGYLEVPDHDPCTKGGDGDLCGYCRTRAESAVEHNEGLTLEEAKEVRWEPENEQSARQIPIDWLDEDKEIIREYFEENDRYPHSRASINRRIDRIAKATEIIAKDEVYPEALRSHAAIRLANRGMGVIDLRQFLGFDGYSTAINILEHISEEPEYDIELQDTVDNETDGASQLPSDISGLKIGEVYQRRFIHQQFGGERFQGLSYPRSNSSIFLFTGDGSEANKYESIFTEEGILKCWISKDNEKPSWTNNIDALSEHDEADEDIHVFEATGKSDLVNYLGEFKYQSHFTQEPGSENQEEKYVVLLSPTSDASDVSLDEIDDLDESELYEKALESAENRQNGNAVTVERTRLSSSELVKEYALQKSGGQCEGCGDVPFLKEDGDPFLEVHHLHRRSDGGPDHPENVVALCPNCHSRVHHGREGDEFNKELIQSAET